MPHVFQLRQRSTYFSIDIRDKDESNILSCIPSSNIFIRLELMQAACLFTALEADHALLVSAYLMSSRIGRWRKH